MHPRLVICLLGSMLIGLAAAIVAVSAGIGLIAAFFVSSFSGSTALVATSIFAAWVSERWPPAALAVRSSAHA